MVNRHQKVSDFWAVIMGVFGNPAEFSFNRCTPSEQSAINALAAWMVECVGHEEHKPWGPKGSTYPRPAYLPSSGYTIININAGSSVLFLWNDDDEEYQNLVRYNFLGKGRPF